MSWVRKIIMLKNTKTGWGTGARAFHWSLGLIIIGMLAFGYWMNHFAARPDRFFYRQLHADVGYLLLVLMVLRLVWRIFNPAPALPQGTPLLERAAAHAVHAALYLLTFVVVFLGWAMSGAHKPHYDSWFVLFRVPQFGSENPDAANTYEHRHILLAYVLLGFIVAHVLAALFHHVVRRDRVLMRMVDGKPG